MPKPFFAFQKPAAVTADAFEATKAFVRSLRRQPGIAHRCHELVSSLISWSARHESVVFRRHRPDSPLVRSRRWTRRRTGGSVCDAHLLQVRPRNAHTLSMPFVRTSGAFPSQSRFSMKVRARASSEEALEKLLHTEDDGFPSLPWHPLGLADATDQRIEIDSSRLGHRSL